MEQERPSKKQWKICQCSVAIKCRAWSVSCDATSGCGGVVVPIAPAKGPRATRTWMVGDRSWHEDGESCPTILLCPCWWGAPVLQPQGSP